MQKYSYVALTPDGKTVKGTVIAQSDEEVKQLITKGGNYCLSYTRLKDEMQGLKPLPIKDVVSFCQQLSAILKAGLPLSTALEMLYGKTDKGPLKVVIGNLYELVEKGHALSEAMGKQGRAFPPIMLNMVKAGELSGDLDSTLNKLAEHFEKDVKLKNQIKAALRYPKMLSIVLLVVVILLVTWLLPSMTASFDPDQLPGTTKFLLGMADVIKAYWVYLLIGVIVLVVAIPMIKRLPKVRYNIDKLKITMPKIGKLMKSVYTSRFARNLATLFESGIQLIEAIQMATAIVDNAYISEQMQDAIVKVKKGETMSKALGATNVFDPLLTAMLYVGEESGVLSEVLLKVADYFDEESGNATAALTAMLEPAITVVMAGVVGFVILSVIQPMFQSYQNVG